MAATTTVERWLFLPSSTIFVCLAMGLSLESLNFKVCFLMDFYPGL